MPNIYMATEVKRNYYLLKIGSLFSLLPFLTNSHFISLHSKLK
jgi:hypothetical protein